MKRFRFTVLLFCLSLVSLSAHASEPFFKGGFILHPSDNDLSDRWLVAFGSDYVIAHQFSLGVEVQTAYYQTKLTSTTLRYVPLNVFANVKYKGPFGGVRPYVGGGLGLISTFFNAGDSEYIHDFGYHLMGGVELGHLEGAAFVVEMGAYQAFSADSNPFIITFLAGVRF